MKLKVPNQISLIKTNSFFLLIVVTSESKDYTMSSSKDDDSNIKPITRKKIEIANNQLQYKKDKDKKYI